MNTGCVLQEAASAAWINLHLTWFTSSSIERSLVFFCTKLQESGAVIVYQDVIPHEFATGQHNIEASEQVYSGDYPKQ